ncbi:hypothetical protein BDZ89DRAFT_492709 [Hymenopellis radicata]|nr:hypothetical protein BDZ89DRAFT_492709 [Hymenopellis radicata]
MSIASSNSHHAESSASAVSTTPIALSAIADPGTTERASGGDIPLPHASRRLQGLVCSKRLLDVSQRLPVLAQGGHAMPSPVEGDRVARARFGRQMFKPCANYSLSLYSRSKSIDLFITFDATGVEDDAGNLLSELALTLLNVLMERSVQWRLVDFVELDAPCVRALDGVQGRLPRLMSSMLLDLIPRPSWSLLASHSPHFSREAPTTIHSSSTYCVIVAAFRFCACSFCSRQGFQSTSVLVPRSQTSHHSSMGSFPI